MHSIKQLKELLGKENIKWADSFKYTHKVVLIQSEVNDIKMRKIVDFCNSNSLFYALDSKSNFYIF